MEKLDTLANQYYDIAETFEIAQEAADFVDIEYEELAKHDQFKYCYKR